MTFLVSFVRLADLCRAAVYSVFLAERTEPLKGQTQNHSAVGFFFPSHKSLMSKFAFHLKIASYYKVMVDNIMALLRIIY